MHAARSESIGRWISVLYRIGRAHIASELEPLGVGKGQHSLLAALYQGDGISQGDLARVLSMDKGSVARALDKLEHAGFIERRRDDADRRTNLVYLTDRARAVEDRLFSVLASWTNTLAEGFTEEERRRTLALLQRMAENAARGGMRADGSVPE
jgi:DNA-binding MarR family transcriptional regulator